MAQRILSHLGTVIASDLVAEIDEDLKQLAGDLRACLNRGDAAMAESLRRWIDERLDERASLTAALPGSGRHRRPNESASAARGEKGRARAQAE